MKDTKLKTLDNFKNMFTSINAEISYFIKGSFYLKIISILMIYIIVQRRRGGSLYMI